MLHAKKFSNQANAKIKNKHECAGYTVKSGLHASLKINVSEILRATNHERPHSACKANEEIKYFGGMNMAIVAEKRKYQ